MNRILLAASAALMLSAWLPAPHALAQPGTQDTTPPILIPIEDSAPEDPRLHASPSSAPRNEPDPCTPRWSDQFGGFVPIAVNSMATWELDGDQENGEELLLGAAVSYDRDFRTALMRWTGSDWAPVIPSGFTSQSTFRVFDLLRDDPDGPGSLPATLYVAGTGLYSINGVSGWSVYGWRADGTAFAMGGANPISRGGRAVYALAMFDPDGDGPRPRALRCRPV